MHPTHQLTVRRAGRHDLDSIVTFSAAMAWETEQRRLDEARLREGTQSLLATPSLGFFMVAEVQASDRLVLVGQLMITYEWSDWRNGVFWWIQSVYVDPAWRRRGVFRRMHEAVASQAKVDPTVCGIRLYVDEENHTAETVYQRVGLARSAYTVFEDDFILSPKGMRKAPTKEGP